MTPILEMEATGEQLLRELPERIIDFKEQRFHIIVTPIEPQSVPQTTVTPRNLTIEEKLLAIALEIPPEERAQVPADLTDQLDHYIYGLPKK
jgi:hypothetical protein